MNTSRSGYPNPSASFTSQFDNVWEAVDGVVRFSGQQPRNRWTSWSSKKRADWFAIDFGTPKTVSHVCLLIYDDGGGVKTPARYSIQYWNGMAWISAQHQVKIPITPTGNMRNDVTFTPVSCSRIRVVFANQRHSYSGLTEIEVYSKPRPTPTAGNLPTSPGRTSPADAFNVKFDAARGGITRLASPKNPALNFVLDGATLGEVEIRTRATGGPWRDNRTAASTDVRQAKLKADGRTWSVIYSQPSKAEGGIRDVALAETFSLGADSLDWTLRLRNATERPLEIGDLALPLRMNNAYTKDAEETFTRRVFRHAFISGHGSFLFWLPVGGIGPHLVMTPHEDTKLELFTDRDADYARGRGTYRVFVYSAATGAELPGTWRQEHTSVVLQPRGTPGDQITCGFRFHWTDDYSGVREVLYQGGGFDIHAAPGMVVPEDLFAQVALRTKNRIESVTAEHPSQTRLKYLGEKQEDTHVYKVKFSRLGENSLTVHAAGGRSTVLEFFVTPFDLGKHGVEALRQGVQFLHSRTARPDGIVLLHGNVVHEGRQIEYRLCDGMLPAPE